MCYNTFIGSLVKGEIDLKKANAKKWVIIVLVSVAAAALLIPNLIYRMNEKLVEQEMIVEDVDISGIAEKTFTGSYMSGQMSADVEVTVINGQYTEILLTDYAGINPTRARQVADAIVQYQTITPNDGNIGTQYTDKIVQKAVYYAIRYSLSGNA